MLSPSSSLEVDLEFLEEFSNWEFGTQSRLESTPTVPDCQRARTLVRVRPCCHCCHYPHRRPSPWEVPITPRELRILIGRVNHYRLFIPNFTYVKSKLVHTLFDVDQGVRVKRQGVVEYVEAILRGVSTNNAKSSQI